MVVMSLGIELTASALQVPAFTVSDHYITFLHNAVYIFCQHRCWISVNISCAVYVGQNMHPRSSSQVMRLNNWMVRQLSMSLMCLFHLCHLQGQLMLVVAMFHVVYQTVTSWLWLALMDSEFMSPWKQTALFNVRLSGFCVWLFFSTVHTSV